LKHLFLGTTLFLLVLSCNKPKTGVIADEAMVVTAHPLATDVGVEILKQGGNAYDAAVAVQFALAVAYPRAGNIGGGGFAVIRTTTGEVEALDFREKAPLAATETMYLDSLGNPIQNLSTFGHLAVGVPGSVKGMEQLHQKYGKLDWSDVIAPSIKLATDGISLTEAEAKKLNQLQEQFYEANDHPANVLKDSGWSTGDVLPHPELAQTLQRIAEQGADGFYQGETASLFLDEMNRNEGIITQEDLSNYKAIWRKPLVSSYNEYSIISMPPPSSGGIALLQLLKGSQQLNGLFPSSYR